ncbi:hypothetical protein TWF694_008267 [Orbilia ellipsospora]|uniref:DUF6594 domain-containing protein n=1 Tax=Orbilia ellipsospora TaxID=2528407 RepID=A0AAV9XI92_9PEZI
MTSQPQVPPILPVYNNIPLEPLNNGPPRNPDRPRRRTKYDDVPVGYSKVATYLNGHEDAAIFRRFGDLKARVLLTQQAEIEEKEERLKGIDQAEEEDANERGVEPDNKTWLKDRNTERKELVEDIAKLLRRYEKDVLLYRQMRLLPKAQSIQIKNYKNVIYNEQPFAPDEKRILDDPDDLVALHKENEDNVELWEPIAEITDNAFRYLRRKIFKHKSDYVFRNARYITTLSTRAMVGVSRLFLGIFVSIVVTGGVIALHFADTDDLRLLVLCVATLLCAILTSILTTAKRGEVFAVAAAYCAVLVVFVGSTLSNTSTVQLQYGNTIINGTIAS